MLLLYMGTDETDKRKTETFTSAHFFSNLPSHFTRSNDQDVLSRRQPDYVQFEQQAPDKQGYGCEQDAEIIHLARNAELRNGMGKQSDPDANNPDGDRQRQEHFAQGLK